MAEETPLTAIEQLALELIRRLGPPEVLEVGPLRRPEEGEVLVVASGVFEIKTGWREAYVVEGPTIIEAVDGFPIHALEVLSEGEGVFTRRPLPGKALALEAPRFFLTYETVEDDGEEPMEYRIVEPLAFRRSEGILARALQDRGVPWQPGLPFFAGGDEGSDLIESSGARDEVEGDDAVRRGIDATVPELMEVAMEFCPPRAIEAALLDHDPRNALRTLVTSASPSELDDRFGLLEAIRRAFTSNKRPAHYTVVLPAGIVHLEEEDADEVPGDDVSPVARRVGRSRALSETLWSYSDREEGEVMEASDWDEGDGENEGGEEE